MSQLITSTGLTTYSMKINSENADNFPVTPTEATATLGNVTITQSDNEKETNYQIEDMEGVLKGDVAEASFNLKFKLASALTTGHRLGFYLNSEDSIKTDFKYSTGELTGFFNATTDNEFGNQVAIWQIADAELVENTEYTIPVTIKYTQDTTPTPGATINLKAYFVVYDGTGTVTNDNMASNTVQAVVYTSVITPTVTSLSDSLENKEAFYLGDIIVFKTTLTPTLTDEYYKKAVQIDFKQTIPESTLITVNDVYASTENKTTGTDGVPAGLSPLTSAHTGSEVSYVFKPTEFPDPYDESVIPTLYVWVKGTIISGPSVPAAPTA